MLKTGSDIKKESRSANKTLGEKEVKAKSRKVAIGELACKATNGTTRKSSSKTEMNKGIRTPKVSSNTKDKLRQKEAVSRTEEGEAITDNIRRTVLSAIEDGKVINTVVYKCNPTYFADFVVIGTGTSSRHVDGAAEKVIKALKTEAKVVPIVDKKNKEWIVIDAGPVIAHIMVEEIRKNYEIDELMGKELKHKPV